MEQLLSAEEMKRYDTNTMEHFGVPSCVLMERAAYQTSLHIRNDCHSALIVCGTGNNGGDGMAIARILHLRGVEVEVVLLGDSDRCSVEAARQFGILQEYKIPVEAEIPAKSFDVVIDAIFGIGLSRDIDGIYAQTIEQMNKLEGQKIAIDIPSGIHADNGRIMGTAFCADLTVTFGYAKYGQLLYPGRAYVGHLVVEDIGIAKESFLGERPAGHYFSKLDRKLLPLRRNDSNKGTYGKVLSVTGSLNMAGASLFASQSAYYMGSGLVYVFTPEVNRTIIQSQLPEAVLCTYDHDKRALHRSLEEQLERTDVYMVGPGLGQEALSEEILTIVLECGKKALVLDADGINLIAKSNKLKDLLKEYKGHLILTPHLKEAARLLGTSVEEIKHDMITVAKQIAQTYHGTCVLKDAATVTVTKSGKIYVNTSGNQAMSKGGSGDVLCGVIGGLIATGMQFEMAAAFGVYLHGIAGDVAKEKTGSYSMLARDLMEGLKETIKEMELDEIL